MILITPVLVGSTNKLRHPPRKRNVTTSLICAQTKPTRLTSHSSIDVGLFFIFHHRSFTSFFLPSVIEWPRRYTCHLQHRFPKTVYPGKTPYFLWKKETRLPLIVGQWRSLTISLGILTLTWLTKVRVVFLRRIVNMLIYLFWLLLLLLTFNSLYQ